MKTKEPQCTFCPYCKNFYAIDSFHLHRYDATPTMRMCMLEDELKKAGWKKSKHIWSK